MTRNFVPPEQVKLNRDRPGAYTFNALIPADYEGICFIVAALRLGDHAHLDIFSGRHIPSPNDMLEGHKNVGRAGRLILRWEEWLMLRGLLDQHPNILIREVENPTRGNLERHVA